MSEDYKKVEGVLGDPVFTGLDEKGEKLRKTLLLLSLCTIFLTLGDLRIDPDSSFLGLRFTGVTDDLARGGLLVVNLYIFVHYLWVLFDSFCEWRLRITGTRVAFVTTGRVASGSGDYPGDPRQSTLYHWWKDQAKQIGNIGGNVKDISDKLCHYEEELSTLSEKGIGPNDLQNLRSYLTSANKSITALQRSIDSTIKVIESKRSPVSLARFDDWFQLFLRSQNLKWLIFDLVTPIFVGGYAVVLLIYFVLNRF